MKPRSHFPKAGRNRINLCKDCSPFEQQWKRKSMPVCGVCDMTEDGWQFTPICVHYDNCMARGERGLWLPCELPMTKGLIRVISLPDDEYLEAVELLKPGFDRQGRPVERGLEYYLERL